MFNAHSSTYKVALWLAVGPFTYFFIGPAFRARTHDELDRGGVLLFTLMLWPLMCWLIQREWHERRTMIRYKNPPRWGWAHFVAVFVLLTMILEYANKNPSVSVGLAITAPICYSLYTLMARACTREQEEMYG
jgi:drug/metabolite transporter (DMT)-like permease